MPSAWKCWASASIDWELALKQALPDLRRLWGIYAAKARGKK